MSCLLKLQLSVVLHPWRTGMTLRNGVLTGESTLPETEPKDVPSRAQVNVNVHVALGSSLKPELDQSVHATVPKCPGGTCCPKLAEVQGNQAIDLRPLVPRAFVSWMVVSPTWESTQAKLSSLPPQHAPAFA